MKSLSKSTKLMFLFDLVILFTATLYWANFFSYTPKAIALLCILVVCSGLIVLYLKGNYKIREFNITVKSAYLLFEGVIMSHILPAAYLLLYAVSLKSTIYFLAVNILTIFILLRIGRAFNHFYLFNVKRTKNILILGTDERARIIADEVQGKFALRMKIAGFVQEGDSEDEFIAIVRQPELKLSDTELKFLNSAPC